MMVHLWSWSKCAWFWAWRPIAIVRAMRHLTLIGTLACTGITIVPPSPPVEAHSPPPPAQTVVTPPPGAPWGYPPAWGAVPPVGGGYTPYSRPIPLGPVLTPPEGREETFFAPEVRSLPEGSAFVPGAICTGDDVISSFPPPSPVDEPGGALLLGMGLACLVLVRVQRAVEPSVRVTILSMEGK